MSADFSIFRITDTNQMRAFEKDIIQDNMYGYALEVYKHFANLDPGSTFNIEKKVSVKTVERFVKITCLYMIDFPGDIQVNNQFNTVTKL